MSFNSVKLPHGVSIYSFKLNLELVEYIAELYFITDSPNYNVDIKPSAF